MSAGRAAKLQWFNGQDVAGGTHTQVQRNVSSPAVCTRTATPRLSGGVSHRHPRPCQEKTVDLGQAVGSAELRVTVSRDLSLFVSFFLFCSPDRTAYPVT